MTDLEFSRPLRVEPMPSGGLEQEIEANEKERAALARLNGLPDIARLVGRFRVAKWKRGVRVEGEIEARLTQTCVVSLEPFEVEITEPVEVRFLPPDPKRPANDSGAGLLDDEPDPLIDGRIDLGAVASEFLTLALDPYPRKPGVAFTPPPETPLSRPRPLRREQGDE